MGIISRRVLPVCGSLCICCPELRARSRQPVKRYKKLLSDIFPKIQDEAPNDRKIGKLTEYASKNPLRIPKIASALEQRGFKELRSERYGPVRVVMRAYSRLVVDCRDQMPLFATSALLMIKALLEQVRHDELRILGCLSLVDFLQNQADSTYMRNVDAFLPKLCSLGRETGEEAKRQPLRAAGLQALASMVSFMGKYAQISSEFEAIVEVILDNYETDVADLEIDAHERTGNSKWIRKLFSTDENTRPKDPLNLNRKESQSPKSPKDWSQKCIQNLAGLSKEATTVRRILDPMFHYFDAGRHWSPENGLSIAVLRDMQDFMEKSGNEQLFLPMLVRHLDHKAVADQPAFKANVVEIIGKLARCSKAKPTIADIAAMSDLLKHLRKSIQFTGESSNPQAFVEDHYNLQTALEDCLKELLKRVGDSGPILDMMASNLEKLSATSSVARATLKALCVLARCIAYVENQSYAEQFFPEALLQQVLKAMMHPDSEVRVQAHQMFSLLMVQPSYKSAELDSTQMKPETSNALARTSSTFSSAASNALFEKLWREQHGDREIQSELGTPTRDKDETRQEKKEDIELKKLSSIRGRGLEDIGGGYSSSSRLFGVRSSIDRSTELKRPSSSSQRKGPEKNFKDAEVIAVRLSGHQAALLLSVLWLQTILLDNMPSNFEAIAHTYMLTLLFSRPKTSGQSTITRGIQLAFSLRNLALDFDGNSSSPGAAVQLPPSRLRSLFTLSSAMLVFACQASSVHQIIPIAKAPLSDVVKDPYLDLSDNLRLKVASSVTSPNIKDYGSAQDDRDALKSLSNISLTADQSAAALATRIVQCSPPLAEWEDYSVEQMLQPFVVEKDEGLGPHHYFDRSDSHDSAESRDSLSFDEIISGAGHSFEDDLASDDSRAELPRLLARVSVSALPQHAIGVSQLLEAALQKAGQVASISFSEAPLSYSDMASKCEAFGFGNRKKISCVLRLEPESNSMRLTLPEKNWAPQTPERDHQPSEHPAKDTEEPNTPLLKHNLLQDISFSPAWLTQTSPEPWQHFKLPPASPYDNFLKAACY